MKPHIHVYEKNQTPQECVHCGLLRSTIEAVECQPLSTDKECKSLDRTSYLMGYMDAKEDQPGGSDEKHSTETKMETKMSASTVQDKPQEDWSKRLETSEFGFDIDAPKLKSFINSLLSDQEREVKKRVLKECMNGSSLADLGLSPEDMMRILAQSSVDQMKAHEERIKQEVAQDILGMIGAYEITPSKEVQQNRTAVRNELRQELRTAISSKYKVKEGKE